MQLILERMLIDLTKCWFEEISRQSDRQASSSMMICPKNQYYNDIDCNDIDYNDIDIKQEKDALIKQIKNLLNLVFGVAFMMDRNMVVQIWGQWEELVYSSQQYIIQYENNIKKDSMELRLYDYRNAKYQGEAIKQQMHGFGILLDQNFTFVMAEWEESEISGNYIAIFSDSFISYGNINLGTVHVSGNHIIYTSPQFNQKRQGKCLLENPDLSIIAEVQVMAQEPSERRGNRPWVKIIQQHPYQQENRAQTISKLSGINIPKDYLSLTEFTLKRFKEKHHDLLQIYQNNKLFKISFRKESLYVELVKDSRGLFRIANIGYEGNVDSRNGRAKNAQSEYGRKYTYYSQKRWLIEQFIHAEPKSFIQFQVQGEHSAPLSKRDIIQETNRPKECIKNLREYYKRSLTFINKYIKTQQIYEIKNSCGRYISILESEIASKEAQMKLENVNRKNNIENPVYQPREVNNSKLYREVSTEDLKKQIQRARSKKGYSRIQKDTYSPTKMPQSPVSSYSRRITENSPYRITQYKRRANPDYQQNQKVSRSFYASPKKQENQPSYFDNKKQNSYESPSARSSNKYDQSVRNQDRYDPQARNHDRSPNRYNQKREDSSFHRNEQSVVKRKRYLVEDTDPEQNRTLEKNTRSIRPRYLQESNKNKPLTHFDYSKNKSNQNDIGKLMKDYKQIENEISRNAPKSSKNSRSPANNRYSYLEHVEQRRRY